MVLSLGSGLSGLSLLELGEYLRGIYAYEGITTVYSLSLLDEELGYAPRYLARDPHFVHLGLTCDDVFALTEEDEA